MGVGCTVGGAGVFVRRGHVALAAFERGGFPEGKVEQRRRDEPGGPEVVAGGEGAAGSGPTGDGGLRAGGRRRWNDLCGDGAAWDRAAAQGGEAFDARDAGR